MFLCSRWVSQLVADIKGANEAGDHWASVLVRTGVFQASADNDPINPADYVNENVEEAVKVILARHDAVGV